MANRVAMLDAQSKIPDRFLPDNVVGTYVGAIVAWGGATAPPDFLMCDGTSQSTASYPELFAVIGYTYGGAGANFNLPNLVGRMPIGPYGAAYPLGATGGAATHTLTTTEMPAHTHVQNAHNHIQDAHNHTQNAHDHTGYQSGGYAGGGALLGMYSNSAGVPVDGAILPRTATNIATTATNQAATAVNQNAGGGAAHNNMPPYTVVNYVIKYRTTGKGVFAPRLIGEITQWSTATAPNGFLMCDGSSKLVADYPALHGVIGYTYGGSGLNFTLPNLAGRVPVGKGSQTEFDTLGKAGGAMTHTHKNDHPLGRTGAFIAMIDPREALQSQSGTTDFVGINLLNSQAPVGLQSQNLERFTQTTTASGTLPPYTVVNYIIKAFYVGNEVPAPNLSVADTSTVDMTLTVGTGGGLTLKADVLPAARTTLAVTDTATLDLTLTGDATAGYTLKGDVIKPPVPEYVRVAGTAAQAGVQSTDLIYTGCTLTIPSAGTWMIMGGVTSQSNVLDAQNVSLQDITGGYEVPDTRGAVVVTAVPPQASGPTMFPWIGPIPAGRQLRLRLNRNGGSTPSIMASSGGVANSPSAWMTALKVG